MNHNNEDYMTNLNLLIRAAMNTMQLSSLSTKATKKQPIRWTFSW